MGYLLGAPKGGSAWGANVWVESAGHAVEEPETARTLYAAAATRWLDEGRTAHYALLPSHDTALVQAWFRLAFGWQHTHAIREPAPAGPVREGLVVRQPERSEIPQLARLDMVLTDHQALSPTFSGGPPDVYEERVADWEEDFDNPKFWNVVVEHDGAHRGQRGGLRARGVVEPHRPGPARPRSLPGLRRRAAGGPRSRRRTGTRRGGLGAGRAAEGYPSIVTDWRETNLLSSRAWRGLGYRDTFTRVHRLVGH